MISKATLAIANNSNVIKSLINGCINGGVRGACLPVIIGPFTGEFDFEHTACKLLN